MNKLLIYNKDEEMVIYIYIYLFLNHVKMNVTLFIYMPIFIIYHTCLGQQDIFF